MNQNDQLPPQLQEAIQEKENFPVGTLAYYGPDDQTCTKIIASVVKAPNAKPQSRQWQAQNASEDPIVIARIGELFKSHGVQEVVMTEGIIGCPHVEGIDYPQGKPCPECPFWER